MPDDISGQRLTDPAEFTRLEDGELDGAACYLVSRRVVIDPATEEEFRQEVLAITGQLPSLAEQEPELLWIDVNTFLLRWIDNVTRFPDFCTVGTTTYTAFVNLTVSEELLRFNPPSDPTS